MTTLSVRNRQTIGWIDALRVIAIILVVISHCCDHFTALYGVDMAGYNLGATIGSLVRPCVPLFAMMTGVLLLPFKPLLLPVIVLAVTVFATRFWAVSINSFIALAAVSAIYAAILIVVCEMWKPEFYIDLRARLTKKHKN